MTSEVDYDSARLQEIYENMCPTFRAELLRLQPHMPGVHYGYLVWEAGDVTVEVGFWPRDLDTEPHRHPNGEGFYFEMYAGVSQVTGATTWDEVADMFTTFKTYLI